MRVGRLSSALLLLALGACEDAAPVRATDLALEVLLPQDPVTTGKAFPLTVVARWDKTLPDVQPPPQLERGFPPLVLKLEGSERSESATHVEVRHRFRAYAFTRTDVTVGPATWAFSGGRTGAQRRADTPRLLVRVRPTLDASDPGPPEVPEELPAEPVAGTPWAVGVAVLVLAVALLLWRRRRSRSSPAEIPHAPPPPGPEAVLARLRATDPASPSLQILELAAILRAEVALRWDVPAAQRTSSETLRTLSQRAVPTAILAPLARVLYAADAVKYGAHRPAAGEGSEALAAAESCVRASASISAGTA